MRILILLLVIVNIIYSQEWEYTRIVSTPIDLSGVKFKSKINFIRNNNYLFLITNGGNWNKNLIYYSDDYKFNFKNLNSESFNDNQEPSQINSIIYNDTIIVNYNYGNSGCYYFIYDTNYIINEYPQNLNISNFSIQNDSLFFGDRFNAKLYKTKDLELNNYELVYELYDIQYGGFSNLLSVGDNLCFTLNIDYINLKNGIYEEESKFFIRRSNGKILSYNIENINFIHSLDYIEFNNDTLVFFIGQYISPFYSVANVYYFSFAEEKIYSLETFGKNKIIDFEFYAGGIAIDKLNGIVYYTLNRQNIIDSIHNQFNYFDLYTKNIHKLKFPNYNDTLIIKLKDLFIVDGFLYGASYDYTDIIVRCKVNSIIERDLEYSLEVDNKPIITFAAYSNPFEINKIRLLVNINSSNNLITYLYVKYGEYDFNYQTGEIGLYNSNSATIYIPISFDIKKLFIKVFVYNSIGSDSMFVDKYILKYNELISGNKFGDSYQKLSFISSGFDDIIAVLNYCNNHIQYEGTMVGITEDSLDYSEIIVKLPNINCSYSSFMLFSNNYPNIFIMSNIFSIVKKDIIINNLVVNNRQINLSYITKGIKKSKVNLVAYDGFYPMFSKQHSKEIDTTNITLLAPNISKSYYISIIEDDSLIISNFNLNVLGIRSSTIFPSYMQNSIWTSILNRWDLSTISLSFINNKNIFLVKRKYTNEFYNDYYYNLNLNFVINNNAKFFVKTSKLGKKLILFNNHFNGLEFTLDNNYQIVDYSIVNDFTMHYYYNYLPEKKSGLHNIISLKGFTYKIENNVIYAYENITNKKYVFNSVINKYLNIQKYNVGMFIFRNEYIGLTNLNGNYSIVMIMYPFEKREKVFVTSNAFVVKSEKNKFFGIKK